MLFASVSPKALETSIQRLTSDIADAILADEGTPRGTLDNSVDMNDSGELHLHNLESASRANFGGRAQHPRDQAEFTVEGEAPVRVMHTRTRKSAGGVEVTTGTHTTGASVGTGSVGAEPSEGKAPQGHASEGNVTSPVEHQSCGALPNESLLLSA